MMERVAAAAPANLWADNHQTMMGHGFSRTREAVVAVLAQKGVLAAAQLEAGLGAHLLTS